VNTPGLWRFPPERATRLARTPADADSRIDFDFPEQRHAIGFGDAASFAEAEDVDAALAMRTIKEAHVLDDPQDVHVDLAKHFNGLADIGERDSRRRGDKDRPGDRHYLNQRKLDVACARREIHDQIIQLAPLDAAQELLHDAMEHRPAPDHRLVARIKQTHRDQLHALRLDRQDLPLVERPPLLFGGHHDW